MSRDKRIKPDRVLSPVFRAPLPKPLRFPKLPELSSRPKKKLRIKIVFITDKSDNCNKMKCFHLI